MRPDYGFQKKKLMKCLEIKLLAAFISIQLINTNIVFSQNSNISQFFRLTFPEKIWVITHPFVVKKAWSITQNARKVTQQLLDTNALDGDYDGGKLDAFRHGFWMASLAQKIHPRKACRLGIAHEKAAKIKFKRGEYEEDHIPDAVASEMDKLNNKEGICIGKKYKQTSQNELIGIITNAILDGRFFIIKKNSKGQFLDCNGEIIPENEYKKKWHNNKCIVASDYTYE